MWLFFGHSFILSNFPCELFTLLEQKPAWTASFLIVILSLSIFTNYSVEYHFAVTESCTLFQLRLGKGIAGFDVFIMGFSPL